MMRLATLIVSASLFLAACGGSDSDSDSDTAREPATEEPTTSEPSPSSSTSPSKSASATPAPSAKPRVIGTIARDLEVPWGIAFLPDGSALVTERDSGRVLRVTAKSAREIGQVAETQAAGEAGLLGVAISPSFAQDRRIFLYTTAASDNRVLRTTFENGRLGRMVPILTGIPKAINHDGGRMVFGPDKMLYVSTGEAGQPDLAQDRESLGGKILRITQDGDPAPGNPDRSSPIWTWGHRNVQGLAFDDNDNLWASEFGQNAFDELNLIEKGRNYGWPEVEGVGNEPGLQDPQVTWSTEESSPSGLAFLGGRLWLGALRGERLWRVDVNGKKAGKEKGFFVGEYGRVRTVVPAPDGNLWVTTSNQDGRGVPAAQDDRILLVRP